MKYKKHNVRKAYRKRTYKKKAPKATPTKGLAHNPKSYQVLNTIKPRIYKFEETFHQNSIVGAGAPVGAVDKFAISLLQRYNNLITMFRQYRINYIKYRFSVRNIDTTDGSVIPKLYVKYNYDPDLLIGALNENTMLRQSNMVLKQFITDSAEGLQFEYTIKPAIMEAQKLYNTSNFTPSPQFKRWCDFDPSGTIQEVEHWGIQYYIPTLATGQTIDIECQFGYECRDLI